MATDLEVPAGAIDLRLQRKHVTNRSLRGPLGTRWRHNWESRLSRTAGKVQIEDWAGVTSFTQVGKSLAYASTSGERVTFTRDGRATRSSATGGSETFDAGGRLVERTYRQGVRVLLRYDAQGALSRVEGFAKSFLSFTADAVGRVIRVEGSTGATVRYGYDKDDLTEAQINGGSPLHYGYDAKGALVKVEDPQTGALDIAYDDNGRETSYRWADGSEQRIEYDDATKTRRVIAANGAVTVTKEDAEKRRTEVTDPLGHKTAIQFDEKGLPVSVTGPTGAASRFSYDSLARILSSIDALGRTTRYEYAGDSSTIKAIIHADGTREEFDYDKDSNLSAVKIGGKIVSALTYNPDGSIASAKEAGAKEQKFTYYPNGLVKSVANALGETTQFEYDARGNLVRETNALGGVTVRSYDSQNRLASVTNPAGETSGYEYDNRGRLMRETSSGDGANSFAYDARGRLVTETNAAGQVTRYEYSAIDQIAKVIRSNNQTESYRYDLAGHLTARTDGLGRTTTFEYDPVGRVTRERWPSGLEVRYRYDAAGNLLAVEDSSGAKSEYQIDASGKTTLSINPTGGKTQYRYDSSGNLIAVTDPLGGVRQFDYTADNELAHAAEPSRDQASYEYDAAGRVVALSRPSGGVTRFTYDKMGNLLTVTDPLGKVKQYSYDSAGRLLDSTDGANRVTRYVYDKAGRLIEKQLPEGKRVTYKYDALGRTIEADDGAFPVRMSYDDAGHLKQITYAAINKSVTYDYDAQGMRTKLLAPDGRQLRYEYDALKRLSALVLPDGKKIAFTYDEKNRILSVVYPNGITGRWSYDAGGQIAKISYQDSRGKAVAASSYRYDATGNAIERQDAQGQSSRFAYDPAGQLVEEASREGAIKYNYGAGGNRARVEEGTLVREYKHNAADQLIQAGAEQLSYDANGNLISRKSAGGPTVYEYDAENRLIKTVTADGSTTTYGYAPTGERVWRRDKKGITYFLYDGLNLIAELDNDLRTKTMFVQGFGIDRPLVMLQEKESYYYVADRVGSVTHLTDDKGKVAASYVYDAFGKIKARQGTVANPFAYAGRELDPTGLYYYRARYYDAELGRFLSKDLIAARVDQPLEQNPYLFVRNNPVRFVDPFGLDSYTPESLAGLSNEALQQLLVEAAKDPTKQLWPIYAALRARAAPPRVNPFRFEGVRQPDGTTEWELRRPDGSAVPESAPAPPRQQVVGRPGQAGPANPNPGRTAAVPAPRGNPTGEVNGGSPNRAGANTNAVRPQPGPAGSGTRQVGEARPGGDTLRVPAAGAPGAGNGFWTLDPRTIRPGITGAGTIATLIATGVDCWRNGGSSCGPKVIKGVVIAGIVAGISRVAPIVGKVAGPIGTLIAGGLAWWEIDKELNKDRKDQEQRDAQAKARDAQAKVNLNNRDAFYPRIEQLRAKINALKKPYDTIISNTPQAQRQLDIASAAATDAESGLTRLRVVKDQYAASSKQICEFINTNQPGAIKSGIERLAAQAESKQRDGDRLLIEARQLAANCGSAADANAIREKYRIIKSVPTEIVRLKAEADKKHVDLEKLRRELENIKGRLPATVTTDVADQALAADAATKEATRLVTQIRDALEVLKAEPQLRQEINALQSAVPEAVLADIQDRFTELHGLLSSFTKYPPLVRYDDQALEFAKRANASKEGAVRALENWKVSLPCQTDVPSAEAAIQRVNTALTMAGLNDAGDLLRQAQVCEASGKCIPVINQARQLIERLQIEEGEAAINQARQQGCNVTGLENTLDYYRSIRDAAAVLFNAREQCKFQEGLNLAQKMPQSIQNSPWVANAIGELRAGLAAQQQVEQYITRATNASSRGSSAALKNDYAESRKLFAQADGEIAQADQIAAPYPCLVDRVNRYKNEYNRLKQSVNNNSGGQGATTSESTGSPTDEIPGALEAEKEKKQNPTDEIPTALGGISRPLGGPVPPRIPAGTKPGNQRPTDEVPGVLGSGKGKQTPTDQVPGVLGSGKGKQTPTDQLPGVLGSGKGKQTPTDEVPGVVGSGKGRQTPTDDVPGVVGSSSGRSQAGKKEEKPNTTGSGVGQATTAGSSAGKLEGTEWGIRCPFTGCVDFIRIAISGGQLTWADRAAQDQRVQSNAIWQPAQFSGSVEGNIIRFDRTIFPQKSPDGKTYWSSGIRNTCTLEFNSSSNTLDGNCTAYGSELGFMGSSINPVPPTTSRQVGVCSRCPQR